MTIRGARRLLSVLAAAGLAFATVASAQTTTGRITGTVADASGGVLPGVTVTVTQSGTGLSRTTTTDTRGGFVFVDLPVGSYAVKVELSGFKTAVRSGYDVVADGRISVDFALEVGALSETVEVDVSRRDGQHHLRRDRTRRGSTAGAEPGAERPQLHAAGDARARCPAARQQRAQHHGGPRHQHVDQRRPDEHQPADGRRRLQHGLGVQQQPDQQRRHRLHRAGLAQDVELLGGVRAQLWRGDQCRDPQRQQRLPRERLRVRPEREDGRQRFLQQHRQRRQGPAALQQLRMDLRRRGDPRQAVLLRR